MDASSSASLAAYINSLTYAIEDGSAWFGKGSSWKVKNGCYWHVTRTPTATQSNIIFSCFNAFSRVDIRVDVKIPGGVNAYVIDLRGERCVAELWPYHLAQRMVLTGTKQLLKYGKKHSSRLFYAPSSTPMIQRIGWMRIASWTQSPHQRASLDSCKPWRACSRKVNPCFIARDDHDANPFHRLASRFRPRNPSSHTCV